MTTAAGLGPSVPQGPGAPQALATLAMLQQLFNDPRYAGPRLGQDALAAKPLPLPPGLSALGATLMDWNQAPGPNDTSTLLSGPSQGQASS